MEKIRITKRQAELLEIILKDNKLYDFLIIKLALISTVRTNP